MSHCQDFSLSQIPVYAFLDNIMTLDSIINHGLPHEVTFRLQIDIAFPGTLQHIMSCRFSLSAAFHWLYPDVSQIRYGKFRILRFH